jgi:hypothetical protein
MPDSTPRVRGGKGLLWHYEAYDGPDQPFKQGLTETPTLTCCHCGVVVPFGKPAAERRQVETPMGTVDMLRCAHCHVDVLPDPDRGIKPNEKGVVRPRGRCPGRCKSYICDRCVAAYPIEGCFDAAAMEIPETHLCYRCNAYTCDKPKCILECHPWQRSLEAAYAKPNANISVPRGYDGALLHPEALEDFTRPFGGVTVPERGPVNHGQVESDNNRLAADSTEDATKEET